MFSVTLSCGHPATVAHEEGERLVICPQCSLSSVVRATRIYDVIYTVNSVQTLFPLALVKGYK